MSYRLFIPVVAVFCASLAFSFTAHAEELNVSFFGPSFQQKLIEVRGGNLVTEKKETSWAFFFSETKGGPWSPIAGCSGTVSLAEAEKSEDTHRIQCPADVGGLNPHQTYFFLFTAKDDLGKEKSVEEEVSTLGVCPLVEEVSVSGVGASSVQVASKVAPMNFETEWWFEYSTSRAAVESGKGVRGPEGLILQGEADENFHLESGVLSGLSGSTTYYVVLNARNSECGVEKLPVVSFETAGAPVVGTFAAHGVDGEAMRALGTVEPHGYDTSYFAEYVTQEEFGRVGWSGAGRTAAVDAGVGAFVNRGFPVSVVGVDMPELQPGVTYRYRLAAESAVSGGVVVGGEQVLAVPVAGRGETGVSEGLGVSCTNELLRTGLSSGLPDCRAYEQVTPVEKNGAQDVFKYGTSAEGSIVGEDGEHVFLHAPGVEWGLNPDARVASYLFTRTGDGWQMQSPRPAGYVGANSFQPMLFNADLTEIALDSEWETSPVAASKEIEFDTGPFGGPYGTVASIPRFEVEGLGTWVAASGDFSKLVLQSKDHGLLKVFTGTTSGDDLYEWTDGKLGLVNDGVGSCGARLVDGFEGYEGRPLDSSVSAHAVSEDGSRVFFQAVPGSECGKPAQLYMRVDGSRTVDIGQYEFLGGDAQGSELVLEHDEGIQHEILLYDTATEKVVHSFSFPEALTASSTLGRDPVVNEQLTTLYFFSPNSLVAEAPVPSPGESDLYKLNLSTGEVGFIVRSSDSSGGFYTGHSVSPDGRYFYWLAEGVSGVPGGAGSSDQAYRYDGVTRLVQCVSCASSFDAEPKLAATFLEAGTTHPQDATPALRDASDNGDYVFFDTPATLVPGDGGEEVAPVSTTGEYPSTAYSLSSDVYEWRKDGVDGCGHVQGCVALISSGVGGYKNVFLGTTPSGRDVFFATHASLVAGDHDTAGDIYDARIDGGFAPPPPPLVECEGCQTPQSGPLDTTPGSFSFDGPIEPSLSLPVVKAKKSKRKRCRKGMVLRHGRCVKLKKKQKKRVPRGKAGGKRSRRSGRGSK